MPPRSRTLPLHGHFDDQLTWVAAAGGTELLSDTARVMDLRCQKIWPANEDLDTAIWIIQEMNRLQNRWAQYMRNLHNLGPQFVQYRQRASLGQGLEGEEAKYQRADRDLKRMYNQTVASAVMLFHRVCRFMGTDPRGRVDGRNPEIDPEFLEWSIIWWDLMATFMFEQTRFLVPGGPSRFSEEFSGPNYQPVYTNGPVPVGSWRDYRRREAYIY